MRCEIEDLGSIPKNKIEGCEKILVTVGFFVVIENFSSEALHGRLRKVKYVPSVTVSLFLVSKIILPPKLE